MNNKTSVFVSLLVAVMSLTALLFFFVGVSADDGEKGVFLGEEFIPTEAAP